LDGWSSRNYEPGDSAYVSLPPPSWPSRRQVVANNKCCENQLPPPPLSSYIPFLKRDDSSPYGAPRPAPGGIKGWIDDRVRAFKNRNNRTAAGAYEGDNPEGNRGGRFDPDEAWDARVGHDTDGYGYQEEQELGYRGAASSTPRAQGRSSQYPPPSGDGYNMNLAATPAYPPEEHAMDRGRSPGLDARKVKNPFDDDNEVQGSLRGVSPRPMDTNLGAGKQKGHDDDDSPTERRSMFRENM